MTQQIGLEAVLDLGSFRRGANQYNSMIGGMNRNTSSTAGKVKSSFGTMGKAILGVGAVAAGAATGGIALATAAIGGMAISGVKAAADLEQQVADIRSVFSGAKPDIEDVKNLILELGINPNLKVTGQEAAAVLEMLARNGLTWTEIMGGAAEASITLANATGADFGTAANIATDAMAIFGIEAENMTKAVDGITSVTVNSKFSINDYALALAQGGGVAQTVGVSFDDFNASIAAISPLFASGSDAGTSFKTFLQRLIPQSDSAAAAMHNLGIITEDGSNQFFDANGNMKSMAEIAGILQQATAGLSDEQKNNALSTIFGADAMRAAAGMASFSETEFANLQATMADTSAAESVALRMDTLKGTMEILSGVMEAMRTKIGDALLPAFRVLADAALEMVSSGDSVLLPFFESLGEWLAVKIPVAIETLKTVFSEFARGFAQGDGGLESAFLGVMEVLDNFLDEERIEQIFQFKDGFVSAFGTISEFITNTLIPGALQVVDIFMNNFALAASVGATAWQAATGDWAAVWGTLKNSVIGAAEFVRDIDWAALGSTVIQFLVSGFANSASSLVDGVTNLSNQMAETIEGVDWESVGARIVELVVAAWNNVGPAITKGVNFILSEFSKAIGESDLEETGKKIVTEMLPGLQRMENALKTAAIALVKGAIAKMFENVDLKQAGKNIVLRILEGLNGVKSDLIQAADDMMFEALKSAAGVANDFVKIGEDIVGGILQGLGNRIGSLQNWITENVVNAIPAWAREGLGIGSPSKVFAEIGENVAEGFIVGIRSRIKDTDEALKEMLGIGSSFSGFTSFFAGKFADPIQKEIEELQAVAKTTTERANELLDFDLNEAGLPTLQRMLMQLENGGSFNGLTGVDAQTVKFAVIEQIKLNEALIEQEKIQAKIVAIEEKRSQLDFLKQQLDLIKLVKDADLPFEAEIFSGLQFGLDADPAAILDATTAAMNQIIQQASSGIAQQVPNVGGMIPGLGGNQGGNVNNSNSRSVTLNFHPTINNGMDMNQFTNQVTQAVSGALATG